MAFSTVANGPGSSPLADSTSSSGRIEQIQWQDLLNLSGSPGSPSAHPSIPSLACSPSSPLFGLLGLSLLQILARRMTPHRRPGTDWGTAGRGEDIHLGPHSDTCCPNDPLLANREGLGSGESPALEGKSPLTLRCEYVSLMFGTPSSAKWSGRGSRASPKGRNHKEPI